MTMREIIEYYDQCHSDYRRLWKLDRNLAIHYGFYDKRHKTHDDAVINMNRVLAKTAKITSKDNVLDAGCGIGGSSIWIAKNIGAKVTGLNIHGAQLKIANNLAREYNVNHLVKFVKGNFMHTRFPNKRFDVIWGLESVCYAENKKDFLMEAKRLLKNKGRIVVADGFLKKENLNSKEKEEMEKWLAGWAVPNLASLTEFRTCLDELGFKNIRFRDVTENVLPSSVRMHKASILAHPASKIFESIGLRTKIQTGNTASAFYQYVTIKKGLWGYGIFYAER